MTHSRRRKRRSWTSPEIRLLRGYHAQGWSDRQIGCQLNRNRNCVMRERVRLGLPANPYEWTTQRRAENGQRARQAAQGVWTEISAAQAAAAGWPGVGGLGQVRALEALAAKPQTAKQLAATLGVTLDAAYSVLGKLRSTKLVQVAEIVVRQRWERVWRLADGVGRHMPAGEKPRRVPRGEGIPVRVYRLNLQER